MPVAVSCVEEVNVVCRCAVFHKTIEPLTKCFPVKVNVKDAGVWKLFGETLVSTGNGLEIVTELFATRLDLAMLMA